MLPSMCADHRTAELGGLRIAYAAFEPFPNAKGSGTRMGRMVTALAGAGADVHLYTLAGRHALFELPAGVTHRPLGVMEPNFLRRGLAFRDRLARELVGLRPDVVHCRGIFEAQAAQGYAQVGSARWLFEVNGLFSVELGYHYPQVAAHQGFQAKLRALEARLLGGADQVVTQSRTTREFLLRRGLPADKPCAVIPNGADPGDYVTLPPTVRPVMRLLYAGTLAPWQGIGELLMATRRVARTLPVRLCLAGPMRRRWQKQLVRTLRRLKLEEAVEVLGPLGRTELAHELAQSDVCLAPLRRDARNLEQGSSPIKLFEYMAAGRALVTTDLPCVREIVADRETGLLASSCRPHALAEQILELGEQRELRESLGQAARRWVGESATWRHRQQALVRAYAELGSRAPSASR
jgi:glycosyltransferase involved in cell wall biosynthesis